MDTARNQVVVARFIIGWIYLTATLSSTSVFAQTLNSTLLEGNIACPSQEVTFTCVTDGSLEWSSDEYIGTGGSRLTLGADSTIGHKHRSMIDDNTYAVLVSVSESILTTELHIRASSSSSVACTATIFQHSSTINFRVLDTPDVPVDAVALQITYMNGSCFITTLWQSPVNNDEASVTHYIIYANRKLISNKIANIDTTAFSTSFAIECAPSHTIDISAGNICDTGQNTTYLIQEGNEDCPINIDTIPQACFVTEAPTTMSPTRSTSPGMSQRNTTPDGSEQIISGNAILIIVSGAMVAVIF